jgi:hypothetical protein
MSCQSLDTSHCQDGAQFRGDLGLLMRFSFGLGPGSESVESVGNEDADAQNNQKCGNSFKHQPILRNRPIERSPFCTVKEIPLWHLNFLPLMISSNIVATDVCLKSRWKWRRMGRSKR